METLGFTIIFLIAAIGIPATLIWLIYRNIKGLAVARAVKSNPAATSVVKKYARYSTWFGNLMTFGLVIALYGYLKMETSSCYPGICMIGVLPMIMGQIGLLWASRTKHRELERLSLNTGD